MNATTSLPELRSPIRRTGCVIRAGAAGLATALLLAGTGPGAAAGPNPTEGIQAIAEEAYIFAYPMLQNYRTMYLQAIYPASPTYVGFNTMYNETHLYGPEFTDVVRPNNDTVYSMTWLDLRAEPVVISVPAIPDRYYSFQLVDLYTFNFGYLGTRTTGTEAGSYLVAGPQWKGEVPAGIKAVFRSEGNFVYNVVRTAVDGEADLPNVRGIQQHYRVQTLSDYLGRPMPPPVVYHPPFPDFPVWSAARASSADFIGYFNYLLGQLTVHPSEKTTVAGFARIGIGPGRPFHPELLRPEVRQAIEAGVASASSKIIAKGFALGRQVNGWNLTPRIFGDREQMQQMPDMYLVRAAAAALGLYGCNLEEAYYPTAHLDAEGLPLDAAGQNHVLRFGPGEFPPVDAFWSITLYDTDQRMVANDINRYSIGDRTPGLVYGEDGSLEILIQHAAPPPDRLPNWLPAPDGPFTLTLRMYLPLFSPPDALYAPPPVLRQD